MHSSHLAEWFAAPRSSSSPPSSSSAARRLDADALLGVCDMLALPGVGAAAGVAKCWAAAAAASAAGRTAELGELLRARVNGLRASFADVGCEGCPAAVHGPLPREERRYNLWSYGSSRELRKALANEESLFPLVQTVCASHRGRAEAALRLVVRLQDLLKAPVYIEHRIEAHPHDQRSVTSLYVHKARLRVNITTVI